MAVFIRYHLEAPGKARIGYMNFEPERLAGDVLAQGVIIPGPLPEPTPGDRQIPHLFYNPDTGEMWYEYIDRPLTQEEELAALKERQKATEDALLELLLSGGAA